jgi:hypothetical protein
VLVVQVAEATHALDVAEAGELRISAVADRRDALMLGYRLEQALSALDGLAHDDRIIFRITHLYSVSREDRSELAMCDPPIVSCDSPGALSEPTSDLLDFLSCTPSPPVPRARGRSEWQMCKSARFRVAGACICSHVWSSRATTPAA